LAATAAWTIACSSRSQVAAAQVQIRLAFFRGKAISAWQYPGFKSVWPYLEKAIPAWQDPGFKSVWPYLEKAIPAWQDPNSIASLAAASAGWWHAV